MINKGILTFITLIMVRTIGYAILGAFGALALGLVLGVGQYFSSVGMSFLVVIAVGAIVGATIAQMVNKK